MVVGLVVYTSVKEGRMDEFLRLIEADAVGSRTEPGCIRFDVVQTQDDPSKFIFYELYTGDAALLTIKSRNISQTLWLSSTAEGRRSS